MAEESTQQAYGVSPIYQLQPDYQFNHNGYGLLTLDATFVCDTNKAGQSGVEFARGSEFKAASGPLSSALKEKTWTCVKAEEVGKTGNLFTVKATYAAIEEGDVTQTEASINSAAVSEPIESHPNFSKIQVPFIANNGTVSPPVPLGGIWTGNVPPPNPTQKDYVKNPFNALWSNVSGQPGILPFAFQGYIPFATNDRYNRKAGVKSWFRPTITMRLTGYTSAVGLATQTANRVGWIVDNPNFGMFVIPEPYDELREDGLDTVDGFRKNWLVTGTNMEIYGGLYKVTADLMLSGAVGWDPDIYPLYSRAG